MGRGGALVRGVSRREKDQELRVSLATPDMIRLLQEALGINAKQAPAYRFYLLDDKVLGRTSGLMPIPVAKQHDGTSGMDGETFEAIQAAGRER
jgi:RNA-directed DNA polymerase